MSCDLKLIEKVLKFSCKRCSRCCCGEPGYVYLSSKDLTKLCTWFNLTLDSFVDKYCRIVPYKNNTLVLSLEETDDFECILWKKGVGCTAYEARPIQCSTYPFWTRILKNEKTFLEEKKECPGIGEGNILNLEAVKSQLELYESNKPVVINSLI
ncbi:MAG: YkgJ family cysteine cluster protein [Treponema sp.]|jgi:uncharacterized protein|nr:YkgJ family cysteine cluster protein [Treponema sp.]